MGVLTTLIIGKKENIDEILSCEDPTEQYDCIEYKGVDTVKISTLYAISKNEEYDMDTHHSIQSFGEEEDGPWVFKFPEDLTKTFASIDSDKIPSIAEKWLSTEELEMDGWNFDDSKKVITEIVNHSKKALESNSEILVWMSL
ncbi:MAG: hypothetical protein Fur0028_05800 [Bacteroidales bacterium]